MEKCCRLVTKNVNECNWNNYFYSVYILHSALHCEGLIYSLWFVRTRPLTHQVSFPCRINLWTVNLSVIVSLLKQPNEAWRVQSDESERGWQGWHLVILQSLHHAVCVCTCGTFSSGHFSLKETCQQPCQAVGFLHNSWDHNHKRINLSRFQAIHL